MAVSKQNMGSRSMAFPAALSAGSCCRRCSIFPGLAASVHENCSSHTWRGNERCKLFSVGPSEKRMVLRWLRPLRPPSTCQAMRARYETPSGQSDALIDGCSRPGESDTRLKTCPGTSYAQHIDLEHELSLVAFVAIHESFLTA